MLSLRRDSTLTLCLPAISRIVSPARTVCVREDATRPFFDFALPPAGESRTDASATLRFAESVDFAASACFAGVASFASSFVATGGVDGLATATAAFSVLASSLRMRSRVPTFT